MSHSHHSHSHTHDRPSANYNRAFALGLALNVGFVTVEAVSGFLVHSLALIADAGHNLSDVLGLLLAWGASFLVRRPPTPRYTYGLRRSSIFAALLNALVLLCAMGGVAWEAIRSFSHPSPVPGGLVMAVAAVGVAINTATALLFLSDSDRDINIRGAFLHMAGDAMVSGGVVLSGIAILLTGWHWFDPAVSLIIVVFIVLSTWQLLRDALNMALDAVPQAIDPLAVRTYLAELPGVADVHDLHIWALSTTETALTAHLVIPDGISGDAFLQQVCDELHHKFDIDRSTLQVEYGDADRPCALASDKGV